jgi:hypothetical protein
MSQRQRTLQETTTPHSPAAVLKAAKFLCASDRDLRGVSRAGVKSHVTMRGQGGEEVAIAAVQTDGLNEGDWLDVLVRSTGRPLFRRFGTVPLAVATEGGESDGKHSSLTVFASRVPFTLGANRRRRSPLRAQVLEAWDAIGIDADASASVKSLKQLALKELYPDGRNVDEYVVKLNGFEILDEAAPISSTAARNGSIFLITDRRRRPVE